MALVSSLTKKENEMKTLLGIALMLCVGFVSAGELDPVQKQDAAQKSVVQKSDATQKDATQKSAVQKGEAEVSIGFFGRSRIRRTERVEARQDRLASAITCRSGSCR